MSASKQQKKNKREEEEVEEEENEEEEEDEEEEGEDDEDDNGGVLLNLNELPKVVANRVRNLQKLQEQADSIDEEYQAERKALERKYIERRAVLYESRRQIVTGEVEPPEVPVEAEEGQTEAAAAAEAESAEPPKGIPQFWPTVLTVHPAINQFVTEEDIPLLEKISDITCTVAEDFTSFTLSFHFVENEYISNAVLTKKYVVAPHLLDDESPTLKGMEGSTIEWKEGKNLCEEVTTKKQRAKSGRNKGQVRTVTTKTPKQSFFHYFNPISNAIDANDDEDEEDEEAEQKKQLVDKDNMPVQIDPESDYDIGHAIRTSLIPEAVRWFTGEAAQEYDAMYGYDDDEDEDGDDEDGEGDDEDDEEDEEEEEEEPKKKGKGGAKKGKGGPAGSNEKPPECKQN